MHAVGDWLVIILIMQYQEYGLASEVLAVSKIYNKSKKVLAKTHHDVAGVLITKNSLNNWLLLAYYAAKDPTSKQASKQASKKSTQERGRARELPHSSTCLTLAII
jgi:hypothetical protein